MGDALHDPYSNFILMSHFGFPCRPTFWRIARNKSTESFLADPYLLTFFNCINWTFYGLPPVANEILVTTINAGGAVAEAGYLLVFLLYCKGRTKVECPPCHHHAATWSRIGLPFLLRVYCVAGMDLPPPTCHLPLLRSSGGYRTRRSPHAHWAHHPGGGGGGGGDHGYVCGAPVGGEHGHQDAVGGVHALLPLRQRTRERSRVAGSASDPTTHWPRLHTHVTACT